MFLLEFIVKICMFILFKLSTVYKNSLYEDDESKKRLKGLSG